MTEIEPMRQDIATAINAGRTGYEASPSINLPLAKLYRRFDARPLREDTVTALIASFREIGIINPLRVRPIDTFESGRPAKGWEIVTGAHRNRTSVGASQYPVGASMAASSMAFAHLVRARRCSRPAVSGPPRALLYRGGNPSGC